MAIPDDLEYQFTLLTAAARYDQLRSRDALASTAEDELPDPDADPLTRQEVLELLALGEVIARKASYGRQLDVRTARQAGASWSQIGAALGMSKQAIWEAHARWIEEQAAEHQRDGVSGFAEDDVDAARRLAGGVE